MRVYPLVKRSGSESRFTKEYEGASPKGADNRLWTRGLDHLGLREGGAELLEC